MVAAIVIDATVVFVGKVGSPAAMVTAEAEFGAVAG